MSVHPSGRSLGLLYFCALAFVVGLAVAGSAQARKHCPVEFQMPRASPGEPVNLGRLKTQLKIYHACQYGRGVEKVLAEASAYVERRAPDVAKPAVVLDIDETSLSNWSMILHNDIGLIKKGDCTLQPLTACGFTAWKLRAQAKVMGPTLSLFNAAVASKVPVFFISGRLEGAAMRAATVTNLKRAGYEGWKALILRSPEPRCGVTCYKRKARAAIEEQGYTIITNIGDQWSDLDPAPDRKSGSYAERIFKVPNPFYFIR